MSVGRVLGTVLIGGALLFPSGAAAQSATSGAIAGVVRDTTGAVVPGVTAEAASPALIEKVKSTVTDDQGQYRIVDLRPGTYSVTFSLTGFSTVKREGVELTTGFTAAVNAELKIGELSETITVSGASPIVDTQNVRNQNVLTRELIEAIPVSQSTQGYAAVTLGVVIPATQQDVGGNRGESVTGSQVHGNRSTDSQRTFDGMGLNTMLGSGAGVNYYFKINSVMSQEVTLTTDGLSAEYETGGLVTNVVPRDGGNRWSGYGVGAFSNKSLQNTNLTDELKTRGLLTAPVAKVIYDAGFGMGGPLKQDRLWFFAGARGWGAQQELANRYYNASTDPRKLFYTPDYSRAAYLDNWAHDSSFRVTHQVNSTNKLAYLLSWQRSCTCWVTGTAAGLNYSPEASTEFHYDPIVMPMVSWNYVATPRLLFEAAGMYLHQTIDSTPTSETDLSSVSVTDLNHPVMGSNLVYNKNNSTLNGLQAYGGPNQSSHWDTRASMAYVTGSHALKIGMSTRSGVYDVTGTFDPPYAFTFNNLTPTSVRVFASPHFSESRLKLNMGIYAQDQWTMNRLTLNLGVRFNYFNAYNPAQSRPASDFYGIPGFDIPEQKNVPNWKDLDPRVGAAYDLFGNGKTALKVSWGRYVGAMASGLAQVVNPANAMVTSATRTWNDSTFGPGDPRTGNYFPDCDFRNQAVNGECQATNPTNFGTVNVATTFADDVLNGFGVRPYTWQGSVAVQHQVLPRLGLMVGYFRTSYGNFTVTDNQNLTPADFDEYCVTVPTDARLPTSGQPICGLYDQRRAVAQQNVIRQASDFGDQTQVFDGIDVGINWRFGQGGILNGGMSTGQTVTDSCFVIDSPDLRYCEQTLPFAAQTQWKFNGSYPLPWYGILVAGTFQNLAGIPQLANRTYTNAEVSPSLGRDLCCASTTTVNNLYEPNIRLEERLTQIDLRFTKDFKMGLHRLRPAFEVYNLLNSSTVTQVDATYGNTGTTWLRPAGIVPARLFKFSLQYNF